MKVTQYCAGTPTTHPVGTVSACRGDDQLELMCSVPNGFLEWSFSLVLENDTTPMSYSRVLTRSTTGSSYLEVGPLTFTFSRTSNIGSLPLMSTLLIRPVSNVLNGTQVNCTDRLTMESQSSRIDVVNPDNDHKLLLGILKLCLFGILQHAHIDQ